ncbi:importin-alpha export receptor [Mortierella sp. AD031]|nr:importin-alpha export receptor [Mortierella sp. AD031]
MGDALQVNDSSMQALAAYLQKTLEPSTRHEAEVFLNKLEQNQNFGQLVLQLIATKSYELHIRFAASLLFKNFVRRNWLIDDERDNRITAGDREAIKGRIVDLMTISEARIQLQLSDAVTQIADTDFPQKWQGLIPELVSKLNPQDYVTNNGLLQTAHSIFQRWRPLYPSDNLYTEIKIALESFCEPYRQVFLATDQMIEANAQNVPQLKVLFETLHLLTEIFHDLNCHDIPDYFVTHLQEFLGLFHKYMTYDNPLLSGDHDEPGPILQVKASICEVVELFSKRYEEDFTSLPEFIQTSWTLLTTLGLEPKNDTLVSKAMSFLTSVVKNGRHKEMFSSKDVLSQLCEKIVLPNMGLRESDEELFEDEPIEYIRRDLEGSDSETRRRAATELVRGLLDQYPTDVTAIITNYIQHYLQRYNTNVTDNWKDKDAAMFLLTSIAAKSSGSQYGVTETNAEVNILDFFEKHVIPDLNAAVSGAIHPILKVDAIKYLYTFRGQFSKDQLLAALPLLARHLESTNYAVYTYAAICIERILFMRVSGATGPMLFTSDEIAPLAETLTSNLFRLIELGQTPEKLAENDYLMKCEMRVILTVREKMMPLVSLCLARLTAIVQAVSSNPSNPKFNHYVFESIGALIRFICSASPDAAGQFETLLFQPFQVILQQDIGEFMPYVFQLMAQLLSFNTGNDLSPAYQAMLPPLVQPTLWQQQGNIPALVKLLQAYLQKGSAWIVANNQLEPLLGVFQKLVSSKINDHHSFELLQTMILNIPMSALVNYMKHVLVVLLTRLQTHKTDKFRKGFINFSFFYMALDIEGTGPDAYWALFDTVQSGLFVQFLKTAWLAEAQKVSGRIERKTCAVAMVRLLTSCRTITEGTNFDAAWPAVMTALVKLFEAPQDVKGAALDAAVDADLYAIDIEETGYQAQFSQLATTTNTKVDPTAQIQDPKQFLIEGIVRFNQAYPGRFQHGQVQLQPDTQAHLSAYLSTAGIALPSTAEANYFPRRDEIDVSAHQTKDLCFRSEQVLYGAYKQATKGDVKGLKPTFFDIAARSKWQAWANMRGKTQDEAKAVYVDLVVKSLTRPDNHPDHYLLADEIIQRPPSPPPSLSRAASPTANLTASNLEKELPPIQFESTTTSTKKSSSAKDTPHPYQHQRKGSVSHSIRSVATGGIHSAAASVYELASEQPFEADADSISATTTNTNSSEPTYHEITETLVEEEILDDDEYANEIQKVTKAGPNRIEQQQKQSKDGADDEEEEEVDDVYQSSEEYDDDESDRGISLGFVRSSTEIRPVAETTVLQQRGKVGHAKDDLEDEGVFDEEDKDELDAIVEDSSRFKLGAPASIDAADDKHIAPLSPLSSGLQLVGAGQDKGLGSPVVEPYRVNVLHETATSSPPLTNGNQKPASVPVAVASPHPHHGAGEEAVCPVSKKTASSGGVCPAAMFAQARAAAAASAKTDEKTPDSLQSTHSSPGPASTTTTAEQSLPLEPAVEHQRAMTEPVSSTTAAPSPPSSSSSSTSAVAAATNQGKRIGQGIVSRFTALRSSLAAASARAASSALAGGTSSSKPTNPNAVVVKDPVTNQSVTVICPHLQTTQVLETEVVRLQTEISVLHERLDLLQESLKIRSQTRAQERRSARGILKMILRQGLINTVLLLIVFAVLYKRKSPIAFAILAYVGQGAKEGEAGWRALMRWSADKIRQGQRNQQFMIRAGRRNGYW